MDEPADTSRLFVGVALPDRVREALATELPVGDARVPHGLRWSAPAGYHVTLQFLGRVPVAQRSAVETACALAARGSEPFALTLGGLGAFPESARARVLWVGVLAGTPSLAALVEGLATHTAPLGFVRESRPYHPHVTVARLKPPADVGPLLAASRVRSNPFEVRAVTLFRSHTASDGARYQPLAAFPLGSG